MLKPTVRRIIHLLAARLAHTPFSHMLSHGASQAHRESQVGDGRLYAGRRPFIRCEDLAGAFSRHVGVVWTQRWVLRLPGGTCLQASTREAPASTVLPLHLPVSTLEATSNARDRSRCVRRQQRRMHRLLFIVNFAHDLRRVRACCGAAHSPLGRRLEFVDPARRLPSRPSLKHRIHSSTPIERRAARPFLHLLWRAP